MSESEPAGPEDDFEKLQRICEKATGRLMVPPKDVETINYFVKNGVVEQDIALAVAWWADNGKVINSINQLQGSVMYQVGARKQSATAKATPKPVGNGNGNGNGHKPAAAENPLAAELAKRKAQRENGERIGN